MDEVLNDPPLPLPRITRKMKPTCFPHEDPDPLDSHLVADDLSAFVGQLAEQAKACGFVPLVTNPGHAQSRPRDLVDLLMLTENMYSWSLKCSPDASALPGPGFIKTLSVCARQTMVTLLTKCQCHVCQAMAHLIAQKYKWQVDPTAHKSGKSALHIAVALQHVYSQAKRAPHVPDNCCTIELYIALLKDSVKVLNSFESSRNTCDALVKTLAKQREVLEQTKELEEQARAFDEIFAYEGRDHDMFCARCVL